MYRICLGNSFTEACSLRDETVNSGFISNMEICPSARRLLRSITSLSSSAYHCNISARVRLKQSNNIEVALYGATYEKYKTLFAADSFVVIKGSVAESRDGYKINVPIPLQRRTLLGSAYVLPSILNLTGKSPS